MFVSFSMSFHNLKGFKRNEDILPCLSVCLSVGLTDCIDSWSLPGRQTTTIQVHTTPLLLTLWEVFEFCCSLNEAKRDQKGASVSLWVWGENVFSVDSGEPAARTYYNQSTQWGFCSSGCKQRDGNRQIREDGNVGLNRFLYCKANCNNIQRAMTCF